MINLFFCSVFIIVLSWSFFRSNLKIFESTATKLRFQIKFAILRTFSLFFAMLTLTGAILFIWIAILQVTIQDLFITYGIAVCFGIITFLILAVVPFNNYTFDKEVNSIKITNHSYLFTQVIQHPLNEIVGLDIEQVRADEFEFSQFNLKLKSGDYLALYISCSYQEKQFLIKSIKALKNFSNLIDTSSK
jgi:hypothetical protein